MPLHPDDSDLLGTCWDGIYFVELHLPFGGRSSVFIFNIFTVTLVWSLRVKHAVVRLVHYLDDFSTCGRSNSNECAYNIETTRTVFDDLGVPLAFDRLIGPVTCIVYLGIKIDSIEQIVKLPADKLSELMSMLDFWCNRRKCTKRELLSLIGKLCFAAEVVRPGGIFLRRLIDLSTPGTELHHHVTLDASARADIFWWLNFLPSWNGKLMIPEGKWTTSIDIRLFTDASRTLGFGAVYGTHWFSGTWPAWVQDDDYSIQWKELFAIYAKCHVWGKQWAGKRILFFMDNEAITFVWQNQSSKCKNLMKPVHKIFLVAATFDFTISLKRISGHYNILANMHSRLQVENCRRHHPSGDAEPGLLPQELWIIWKERWEVLKGMH